MTYEAAIIVLKEIKKDMFKNGTIGAIALDLAVEALQKQVPMKPVVDGVVCNTDLAGYEVEPYMKKVSRCPKCHNMLSIYESCKCGQRIDWSDKQ